MRLQLQEKTPIHQAASQLEEAISLVEEILASSESGPMVEKLEQSLRSIRNEHKRLQRALETSDIETVLKELERLTEKVACALRNFKSLFTV